jgi:2,4-dienoyl-CoA reductase-like NADH-dependent reductase (Old Yellow Enzyme family)
MWKPAERIRYHSSPGIWPNAAEARAALLFQELTHGRLCLRERTWVPAMVPWRATADGYASDDVIAWYRRFAQGRPGAIVVEATGVRDVPSGPLLRIGDDRFVPGLKRLVAAVREASGGHTRLFIQLIDFLAIKRRPDPEKFLRRFLEITAAHRERLGMRGASEAELRDALTAKTTEQLRALLSPREFDDLQYGARERVTDMQLAHIRALPRQLPRIFADAAVRAQSAGFDGVELH